MATLLLPLSLVALANLLAASAPPPAACAAPAAPLRIAVDWQTRRLPRSARAGVLAEAARIWRPYGVTIDWIDEGADLRLVVSDDRLDARSHAWTTALGWLEFVDGAPGRVLHVSVTATLEVVEGLHVGGRSLNELPGVSLTSALTRALGRAAAHEIGHYLFASPAHTARGLMRSTYPAWEAASPQIELYRLDPAQIRALRARVGAECATP